MRKIDSSVFTATLPLHGSVMKCFATFATGVYYGISGQLARIISLEPLPSDYTATNSQTLSKRDLNGASKPALNGSFHFKWRYNSRSLVSVHYFIACVRMYLQDWHAYFRYTNNRRKRNKRTTSESTAKILISIFVSLCSLPPPCSH